MPRDLGFIGKRLRVLALSRAYWRECAVYVCVGFFAFWLDPFGFEHAARFQLQDATLQALSEWHATDPRNSPVAVVLWSDRDVARLRAMRPHAPPVTWPLSYGVHAEVLGQILEAQPSRVFVDVLFKDERSDPTIDQLQAVFQRYKRARRTIYLSNERGCGDKGIRSDLLVVDDQVIAIPVPVPIRDDAVDDAVIREYPTFANRDALTRRNPVYECATAALRMHVDLHDEDRKLKSYAWPFVLRWGGCAHERSWMVTIRRWQRVFFGGDVRHDATCVPFHVVEASALLSSDVEAAKAKLQGKLVVYGTSVASAGDLVPTPVHRNLVPGAVVHAMALENLQRWHDRYLWRIPFAAEDRVRFEIGGADGDVRIRLNFVDVMLLLFGGYVFALFARYEDQRLGARSPAIDATPARLVNLASRVVAATAFVILPPFVLFATLSAALFAWGHVSPVNVAPHIFVWILVENVKRVRTVARTS